MVRRNVCLVSKKLVELYNKIISELGNKFDIEIGSLAKETMFFEYDIDSINKELTLYLDNPLDHYKKQGISNSGDYQLEKNQAYSEYMRWKQKEETILYRNSSNVF